MNAEMIRRNEMSQVYQKVARIVAILSSVSTWT